MGIKNIEALFPYDVEAIETQNEEGAHVVADPIEEPI